MAQEVLNLMVGLGTAGKDGYTLVHHFYQAYKSCKDADHFFVTLTKRKEFPLIANSMTYFEETPLDIAVNNHNNEALLLSIANRNYFNFNNVSNS